MKILEIVSTNAAKGLQRSVFYILLHIGNGISPTDLMFSIAVSPDLVSWNEARITTFAGYES